MSGAGGNRTLVHQAMNVRATTVPDSLADAARPAGRLTSASGGPRSVFAECQQTFLQSAVFLAVIPRFCCRAAVDRPRAPFLVTMSLRYLTNQAARANCSLAILFFAPFSESEQLGSHARPQILMSKPVSPVFDCPTTLTANECFRHPRMGRRHSVGAVGVASPHESWR
jgi:hypothetical protein